MLARRACGASRGVRVAIPLRSRLRCIPVCFDAKLLIKGDLPAGGGVVSETSEHSGEIRARSQRALKKDGELDQPSAERNPPSCWLDRVVVQSCRIRAASVPRGLTVAPLDPVLRSLPHVLFTLRLRCEPRCEPLRSNAIRLYARLRSLPHVLFTLRLRCEPRCEPP